MDRVAWWLESTGSQRIGHEWNHLSHMHEKYIIKLFFFTSIPYIFNFIKTFHSQFIIIRFNHSFPVEFESINSVFVSLLDTPEIL